MVSKEFIEKEWIKAYNALNPFLDVNGAYELRKLLYDFKNNEKFIFISVMLIMPVLLNLMN